MPDIDTTQAQTDRLVVEAGEIKTLLKEAIRLLGCIYFANGGPIAATHHENIHAALDQPKPSGIVVPGKGN